MARERDPLDRYYTPPELAAACVATLDIPAPATIVEPSVGGGAFLRAARARWPDTVRVAVDVDHTAAGLAEGHYRYVEDWPRAAARLPYAPSLIIGNPPYRHAEEHLRAALATGARTIAFLLRLGFLAGRSRSTGIWRTHPPSSVHVLAPRPSFSGDGRTDGQEYAWMVWTGAPSTELRWLVWR